MLAGPEVHCQHQCSFAGSITLVFASGIGLCPSALEDSLTCAVSGASSGCGEEPTIKDALLARETVEQVDDFAGRVKAKHVEPASVARCPLSRKG